MKTISRIISQIEHIIRSRKSCKGNCLTCPYYEDCFYDLKRK